MTRASCVAPAAGLFAFASVATALRFAGLPFGVGELCGIVLVIVAVVRWRARDHLRHPLMLFWYGFGLATGVGFLFGSIQGSDVMHTAVAYVYAACLSLMALSFLDGISKRDLRRIIVVTSVLSVALLVVPFSGFLYGQNALTEALGVSHELPSRLSGWSKNPNQLAFFMLTLPIWLAAVLAEADWRGWRGVVNFLFLLVLSVFGLSIRSDGLVVSWVFGLSLLAVVTPLAGKANWRELGTMAAAFLVAFCLFKIFIDGFGCVPAEKAGSSVESVESGRNEGRWCLAAVTGFSPASSDSVFGIGFGENKGEVRERLWKHAIGAWRQSLVFGHGPGVFSYMDDPAEREEAHNIFLDILTQGGIVAAALFAALYLWLMAMAWKARDPYALTVLVILMLFGGAHFMLRQPMLTLNLALCAVVSGHGWFGRRAGNQNHEEAA